MITALRLAVAAALVAWLATQMDWSALGATLRGVDPRGAGLGLAVLWFGLAVAVVRWQRILHALGANLRTLETTRIFGSGLFLNLFLPTSVGGDVYRLARVQQGGFGPWRATVSLAVERGVGLVALLALVIPAVILHERTRDFLLVAVALGAAAVALLVGARLWGSALADALSRRWPVLAPVLAPEVRRRLLAQVPATFAFSLVIHLCTVGSNWIFARALGIDLGFWDALALIPLVVLAGQIPISPGGLGVREAGFVFFLGRAGVEKEPALAVGLTWLAALYLTGGLGALLFLSDRRSRETTAPGEEAAGRA